MNRVNSALRILAIWLDSAEKTAASNSPLGRKYALRWKAVGLINHDRVLNGRADLIHSFSGAPK